MKYSYKISKLIYNDGDEDLIIVMDDKKYRLVAQFLMSDVQGDPRYAFEAIDNVLSGKSKYEELNGNVCGVEIHKEKTQIYDNLAENGRGDWCEIETAELRKLVKIWCDELKKFKEKNIGLKGNKD